jgi:hypothetical protein
LDRARHEKTSVGVDVEVDAHEQRTVFTGFTGPGLRGVYTPGRVAIQDEDGAVLQERRAPRETFPARSRVTHHDIARTMASTLGFPVHYEPISVEEFASAMHKRGLSEHLVQHLSNVAVDYPNGVFAGTNDNVETLGHRVPLSAEQFVVNFVPTQE